MKKRRKILGILLLLIIVCLSVVMAIAVSADDSGDVTQLDKTDAMEAINAAFAAYKVGDTVTVKEYGYVTNAPKLTTYYDYDEEHGAATPGFYVTDNATQLVIYVVNTNTERVGMASDEFIIGGMLDRGYIVAVLDYMNYSDADETNVAWSTQLIRTDIYKGSYFSDTTKIPKTESYFDNYVVPAGYDVEPYQVFWEADKHGAEGSLEEIVDNWNHDFRSSNAEVIIPWVDENGERKSTQNAFDGSSPVWLDSAGKADENGTYIKVKYTLANDIYDCVAPDGSALNLSLFMHVVYPVKPVGEVAILADSNSSGHITLAKVGADVRALTNGLLFEGYAGVAYDYLWFPMARTEYYGYYDGRIDGGGYTNDQMNYSLHLYNDKRINTAAMRYLRYLDAAEPDKYKFDTDAIGVYGNSKGSWITFLGNEELTEYTVNQLGLSEEEIAALSTDELEELIDTRINNYVSRRAFPNHIGETRYQIGEANCATASTTKNGITIDKGERQPWLTYDGKEILGNANLLYPCCGPMNEDMVEGHVPMIASMNLNDEYDSAFASSNVRSNLFRTLDVPSLYMVTDAGHMYTYGPDRLTGIDTYEAMFDFMGYFLQGDAVKVLYTTPLAETANIETTSSISVKFTGIVNESELEKITIVDKNGAKVSGAWTSACGKTEWTFTPDTALSGGMTYTLTVPAGFAGHNGNGMTEAYVANFETAKETGSAVSTTVGALGTYFEVTVPDMSASSEAILRFHVANDAANIAELYTVSGFDSASPDSSTVGELVGALNLSGAGYYEFDISDCIGNASVGDKAVFLLKAAKSANGEAGDEIYDATFETSASDITMGRYASGSVSTAPDGTAALEIIANVSRQYANKNHIFYEYPNTIFTDSDLIKVTALEESDEGRRFRINLRVYDTVTRIISLQLNSATSLAYGTIDLNASYYNFYTKAGEWVDLSFDYVVYETDFGDVGEQIKKLTVMLQPVGEVEYTDSVSARTDYPLYLENITVTEYVTDITLSENGASLVLTDNGYTYKAPTSEYPLSIGENSYATLGEALSAAASGDTLTLNSNYRLTAADSFTGLEALEEITVDMNGYRIYLDSNLPLVNAYASANTVETTVTFKNGAVSVNDSALITAGGTSAGDGKVFNIRFENMYIYTAKDAWLSDFMLDASASQANSEINVTMNDTVLDVNIGRITDNPLTVFSESTENVSVNYEITGGKLIIDSVLWVTFIADHNEVELLPDENEEYTKLYTSVSTFTIDLIAVTKNRETLAFTLSESDGCNAVLEAAENSRVTKYGIITEEYANVELYPVAIFDANGNFGKAYESFEGMLNYFKTYSTGEEYFAVLRRDFTYSNKFDNLSQAVEGSILNVDLLGHTITLGEGRMLYDATSKTNGDITVNTYNGTVLASTVGAVKITGWATSSYDTSDIKRFDFNFSNIKFALAADATTSSLVTYYVERGSSTAGPAYNDITFTDCTFDISGATKTTAIFNAGAANGGQTLSANITVNGGSIIADNASYLNIYNLTADTGSKITFGKGTDGKYTSLSLPAGSAAPTDSILTAEGNMIYAESETAGTYTLVENVLDTPYGTIGADFADKVTYPWAIFDKNKNFIAASSSFTAGIATKVAEAGDGAVILLRCDYTMTSSDQAGCTYLGRLNGSLTIDLGAHTMTMKDVGADAFLKCEPYANGYKTFITVINGTIEGCNDPLVRFASVKGTSTNNRTPTSYCDNDDTNPQTFNVTFDGITINAGSSATATFCITNVYSTYEAKANANVFVKDCEINITTAKSIALFNTISGKNNGNITPNCVVIGGSINTTDASKLSMALYKSTDSPTHTFAKDENGEYTTMTVPTGTSPLADLVTDANDSSVTDLRFVEYYIDGENTVYVLRSLVTPYGTISDSYASLIDYPWVVFDKDGNCKAGTANFTVTAAKAACAAGDGAAIVLRCDFDLGSSAYAGQSLSTVNGSVTVDLGGYTVSMSNGGNADAFIRLEPYAVGYTTSVTVKNGTVLSGSDPIVRFAAITSRIPENYVTDSATNPHNLYVTLDGLKIGIDSRISARDYLFLYTMATAGLKVDGNNNLTVKDCDIDISNIGSAVNLFASNNSVPANVFVLGGTLAYSNTSNITYEAMNRDNGSTITFGKGSDGEYIKLILPTSLTAPTTAFTTSGGSYKFTKISASSGKATYTLRPTTLGNLKVKTSIVLYSDFVYNIYVLKADNISEILINGVAVSLSGAEEVEIDGVIYYMIPKTVAAAEAADSIILTVKLAYGDDIFNGTWTLDIIKYAQKVINGSYTDTTKTLMKDMLSYIKATYQYFATVGSVTEAELSAATSRIDEVLGDYTSSAKVTGEAVNNTSDCGFTKATVSLGARISFRFYIENTENAKKYVFTQNGKLLDAAIVEVEGGESYIEVTTYAYGITETVFFTAKIDENTVYEGSYNLKAYYDYLVDNGYTDAAGVVTELWKYSDSAKAYKAEVTANS